MRAEWTLLTYGSIYANGSDDRHFIVERGSIFFFELFTWTHISANIRGWRKHVRRCGLAVWWMKADDGWEWRHLTQMWFCYNGKISSDLFRVAFVGIEFQAEWYWITCINLNFFGSWMNEWNPIMLDLHEIFFYYETSILNVEQRHS